MLPPLPCNAFRSQKALPPDGERNIPPLQQADNALLPADISESPQADESGEVKNKINVTWSSQLSNPGELDFIWCPEVDLTKLSCSSSEYGPESGGAVIFVHSNGSDLFIRGRAVTPELFSQNIIQMDGYYDTSSPLILAACRAGNKNATDSIAQRLANALDRTVIASSGMVYAGCNDDKTHITKISSNAPFLTFTPANPPSYNPQLHGSGRALA